MKCQFGLLHIDGKPATHDDRVRLLAQFEDRPADIAGEIVDGPLVMAYRGDRITAEEESEIQPLNQWGSMITWDGRLDNRDETATRLGLNHCGDLPDPEIVVKSYQAFRQQVFNDLIGEFALTLWSKSTKTLRFVRSTCGARPLFYTVVKGTLFWSSDFAHLVRVSGCDLEVNETYFLEYLITQPSTKLTPLSKVHAVPANTLLEFADGQMKQPYPLWDVAHIETLRYRTDDEYEEHFRQVLEDAVRVRLRARPPIFAELSGGLDSSSIVLTADQVLKANNRPLEDLQTISGVYEESSTSDERKFIQLVEERRGRPTLLVSEKEQRFTLGLDDPEFTGLPNPNHCSPGRYETFARLMKVLKGRVLLTGLGGDHLFWSAPEGTALIADELRRGNIRGALKECRVWSRATRLPFFYLLLKRAVPLAIGLPYNLVEAPNWLSQKMHRKVSARGDTSLGHQVRQGLPSRRAQLFAVDLLFRSLACGYYNDYTDLYVSHPYSHRPLVEFCLAASLAQFLRGGQSRSLMRRALVQRLPAKICRRSSKAGADEAYMRALHREWPNTADVRGWQVCQRGFVDSEMFATSLAGMHLGFQHQSGYLIRLVSIERWLRSLERIRIQTPSTALPNERRLVFLNYRAQSSAAPRSCRPLRRKPA